MRVNTVHHEGGDGAWRVIFASVARRLQIVENLFVYVAEMLALGQIIEINGTNLVHYLPHELA